MHDSGLRTIQTSTATTATTTIKLQQPKEELKTVKLGDGCYHVFLDIGANIGVHGRFIFEPRQYPDIKNETKLIFSEQFGEADTRDPRDICVFAFEPNPAHKNRHINLQEAYKKVGIRYYPVPAGVSDFDGNLTFYHQGGSDPENNEWGFSTTQFNTRYKKEAIEVPVIRLKSWLEENIFERSIPEQPFGGEETRKKNPAVVMKIDIEGSEYQVLPDLMASGVLCNTVDLVFGEWHTAENAKFATLKKYRGWKENLSAVMNIFSNVDGCKLQKFLDFDDEGYHLDGIPFPSGEPWW